MVKRTMVLAILTFALFHVPTVLTGRVLVSDAPIPDGFGDVVEGARHGVQLDLAGFYGLRLAALRCNGDIAIVYFDVLGPFAPARALVASSGSPRGGSDPGWRVTVLTPTPDHPDAASFMAPDAPGCEA